MKKIVTLFLFATSAVFARATESAWMQVTKDAIPSKETQVIHPSRYLLYSLQEDVLKSKLFSLSEDPSKGVVITLPMPDGKMKAFKVWQAAMMEPGLAASYPGIRTFTAVAVDNKDVTAKLDITLFGFHAMIFNGSETSFIDPFSNPGNGYYLCYYKKDMVRNGNSPCLVSEAQQAPISEKPLYLTGNDLPRQQLKINGSVKRTYRLALSCTGEYSIAIAYPLPPTKALSLSAMITSMNRVNGVFEREVGIHMNLIANDTAIIYTDFTTDPFTANNDGQSLMPQNQSNTDAVIGTLNYDIGHIFSTGGGGVAEPASACSITAKAQGVTGQPDPVGDAFDIDFVAHEMGHQYGAMHTFNAATGQCGGKNAIMASAYEPGSASSIMGYAGICGAQDNLQAHSDDYFHAKSLDQIVIFVEDPTGGGLCAATSPSGNVAPVVGTVAQTYTIPFLTPFELTAPAVTDTDHDTLTYDWEQYDLGDFKTSFDQTKNAGPIFRSFQPTTSPTRIFPTLTKLLAGSFNYLGEKLPEVTRTLTFRLTVRDMLNGWGCFNSPSDKVTLNVVSTAGPFSLNFPSFPSDHWQSGATATVDWSVANTDKAPVNCSNVDIMLSTDGGYTYPYTLLSNTSNDGNETVTVPAGIYSSGCRVKVKGTGNVFFAISRDNFSVFPWPSGINTIANNGEVSIYPVPAKSIVHVDIKKDGVYKMEVTNTVGQQVLNLQAAKQNTLDVSSWAKGVYNLTVYNEANYVRIVQKIVVQ